ncbi:hypothetical protein [Mucilaginibacter sp. R-33]|uniref:hypothetical protein n=1 Tax=Mucilaginibacter sp. R-33 TaxID=3416711 RepID=UPI003CEF2665
MYDRPIAPWEHFPKTLTISELLNPLKTIKEYFDTGLPKKKFDKIDQWRDFVLKYDYYNDPKLGPESLLLVYDQNLRFMEATHLFLINQTDLNRLPGRISKDELKVERREWDYYPITLSDDEIIDPYITLEKCFKGFPPQLYRDHLHEWLHAALSTQADFDVLPPSEVMAFHECIKRLIDAGWLFKERLNHS